MEAGRLSHAHNLLKKAAVDAIKKRAKQLRTAQLLFQLIIIFSNDESVADQQQELLLGQPVLMWREIRPRPSCK
ncbi:hypothetical protein BC351_20880 [Paenibacillus ferrarius]|uniref:Uncharacterized protein n=1 Tax=Paenibacillus ferrarius TaxID=1469647 RepID=A0A1V4HNF8_9BACL|nr:hypothetical protein BC351_20880 [Paenibacillus ferrarius]